MIKLLIIIIIVEYPEKLACEIRWNEVFDESSYYIFQIYIIALSIIELYIPFALMTVLYSIILFKLKTQKVPGEQSVSTENLRAKKQRKVLKMAIAIVSVFVIGWMPMSVLTFLSTFVWDSTTSPSCGIVRYWLVGRDYCRGKLCHKPLYLFYLQWKLSSRS